MRTFLSTQLFEIEDRVREFQKEHEEVWVFAGPIFGPGDYDSIGNSVQVAPLFFRIIVWEDGNGDPAWEAYMMPHHQENHGDIREQLVSIRHIEAMTGLNFFQDMRLGNAERISTYESN